MNKYTGNNSKKGTSLLLSISLFIIPPLYIRWQTIRRKENEKEEKRRAQTLAELNKNQSKLWPPLPKIVQSMLSKSRLAYLSTIDADSRSSHLSLMRFTYLRDEEIIVLSTNVNTKKYRMLEKQKGVALLVHDFGSGKVNHSDHEAEDGNYSITLNGECSIVEPGRLMGMLIQSKIMVYSYLTNEWLFVLDAQNFNAYF